MSTAYKLLCTQLTQAYVAKKRPASVVIDFAMYVSAHDQFAQCCANVSQFN